MNWLRRPEFWFPPTLLLLIAGGAKLLNNPTCQSLDERDWRWFARANAWRSTFDAVSAACGVGLLTHDIDEEYTATGKWALSGIGVAGAALWIGAVLSASRRFWRAAGTQGSLPPARYVIGAFVGLVLISVPVTALLEWISRAAMGVSPPTDGFSGSAWRAISASASLGWLPGNPPRAYAWTYAAVGLAGGLGWMVWLLPFAKVRREHLRTWTVLRLAGGYMLYLLVVAGLVFLLESPRGQSLRAGTTSIPAAQLSGQPALVRYGRSLTSTICAATAGIPVENLGEGNVTDASKFVLAGNVLIGSLVGSAGGGVKWTFFVWFVSGGLASAWMRRRAAEPAIRRVAVAAGYTVMLSGITCVTAFGLLVIEARNARNYEEPPTFAAALLDASSAVGGANLSTGIAHVVTGQNLSRGIGKGVDSYQCGMALLMAAMFAGRVLLVLVLGWMAGPQVADSEASRKPTAT